MAAISLYATVMPKVVVTAFELAVVGRASTSFLVNGFSIEFFDKS